MRKPPKNDALTMEGERKVRAEEAFKKKKLSCRSTCENFFQFHVEPKMFAEHLKSFRNSSRGEVI